MIQDILGRIPQVGDKIMVKSHYSPVIDQLATITKINKVTISVELYPRKWVRYNTTSWDGRYVIDRSVPPLYIKRKGLDFIIVNEQLAYNQAQWPELYI